MSLNKPLWPHQQQALNFAKTRAASLLAMGMRSGKTLTTLALVEEVDARFTLIVASKWPVSMVWTAQIEEHTDWYASRKVLDLSKGTVAKRADTLLHVLSRDIDVPLVVLVNYDVLHRDPLYAALRSVGWDLVVLDESHRIKTHNSKISKAAHRIGNTSKQRVCLTGTPYKENPLDIYGQARFLDERLYAVPKAYNPHQTSTSWTHFRAYYAHLRPLPSKRGVFVVTGYKNLDDLHQRLAGIMFEIKTEDVIDVPPSQIIDVLVELPPKALKMTKEFAKEYILSLTEDDVITAPNVIVQQMRLRQATGGFLKLDNGRTEVLHTAKIRALEGILEGIGNDPAVIFGVFKEELDAILNICRALDIKVGELSGRGNDYEAWNKGNYQILVCQYQAGAEAYDMKRAGITIYYSPTYKLGEWEQSLARTKMHDGGLVTYYRLIAQDTIDEKVYDALDNKKAVIESLG